MKFRYTLYIHWTLKIFMHYILEIIITFVQLFMPYFTVEYTKAYTAHTNFTVASFTGHRKAFCCSHWENVGFGLSPLRLTMQVASVPLGLVSTQASLTSRSIHLAKPPFFQKPVAVVVIVDLVHLKIARNGGRGCMHETNWIIWAHAPCSLLP